MVVIHPPFCSELVRKHNIHFHRKRIELEGDTYEKWPVQSYKNAGDGSSQGNPCGQGEKVAGKIRKEGPLTELVVTVVGGSRREGLGESVLTNIIGGLDVYRHVLPSSKLRRAT